MSEEFDKARAEYITATARHDELVYAKPKEWSLENRDDARALCVAYADMEIARMAVSSVLVDEASDKSADNIRWRENINRSMAANARLMKVLDKLDRLATTMLAEKGMEP